MHDYFKLPPVEEIYKRYLKIYPVWAIIVKLDEKEIREERLYRRLFSETINDYRRDYDSETQEMSSEDKLHNRISPTIKEKEILTKMMYEGVEEVIDKECSPIQAKCYKMKYSNELELTNKEIAKELGCSTTNVQKHIEKAIKILRKYYDIPL